MIRYRLVQDQKNGQRWTSEVVFEAATMHEVSQAVRAGYLHGEARRAETLEGKLLFGLDKNGKEES